MALSTSLGLEGERRYHGFYVGLGGGPRHLNPEGRGAVETERGDARKGEHDGWPRCLGWKGKTGSGALGQLTDLN